MEFGAGLAGGRAGLYPEFRPDAFSPQTPASTITTLSCGRFFATGSKNGNARVYDADLVSLGLLDSCHEGEVTSVAFAPDCSVLATCGGHDKCAKLWSLDGTAAATDGSGSLVKPGQIVAHLEGHTKAVNHAVFSPDGSLLATCSNDCSIMIWSTRTGANLCAIKKAHESGVTHCVWKEDGKTLASVDKNGSCYLHEIYTGLAGKAKSKMCVLL